MSKSLAERLQFTGGSVRAALRTASLYALGALRFAVTPIYGGLGTILAFHRVVEAQPRQRVAWVSDLEVTTATLEELLRLATRDRRPVLSLDEIHDGLVRGTLNHRFMAFTFDDGYRDNLTLALPLFEAYRVPFAVYLTTDYPDRRMVFWWYALEEALLESDHLDLVAGGQRRLFLARTPAEKTAAFQAVARLIDRTPPAGLLDFCRAAFGAERVDRLQATLPLSWDDVRALARSPLATIGAHTVSHPVLSGLSPVEVEDEMRGSRRRIEAALGIPIRHFAYPYGTMPQVTARELAVGRTCGFATATTARPANVFPEHAHHLECLPRYVYGGESLAQLSRNAFTGALGALRFRGRRVVTC